MFRAFIYACIQIVCIVLLWTALACDRPAHGPDANVAAADRVAAIRVTPSAVVLPVGQSLFFSVIIGDAAGNRLPARMEIPGLAIGPDKKPKAVIGDAKGRSGKIVAWRTVRPDVAKIGPYGRLTSLTEGEVSITATCEGRTASAKIIVTSARKAPVVMVPSRADLRVGETIRLKFIQQDDKDGISGPDVWRSDHPDRASVNRKGVVKAISAGTAAITADGGGRTGTAIIRINPASTISGLDFPGNAGVHKTMRFEFSSPLAAYPATYIWRVYPRQQQSYYTAFFWGNNGAFFPSNTYYGFHPYPDWKTSYQHFWEVAAPPGEDSVSPSHVVYDRWYIQVAVCRKSGDTTTHEFYWDWPDTAKVVRYSSKQYDDPPNPGLVVGDAPWNPGNEVWDGVLRGFQFYDTALTKSEIEQEIASPGSIRMPWYLNLNPKPVDISDRSGSGHHPAWVGADRPAQWTGISNGGTIIRSAVVHW